MHLAAQGNGDFMKILIAGGLGHIGSLLVRYPPLSFGVSGITIVDDLSTQRFSSVFDLPPGLQLELVDRDVRQYVTPTLAQQFDAVVHLAAITNPSLGLTRPTWLRGYNLSITESLANACIVANTPLIFASSTSVYTPSGDSADEQSSDLNPTHPYASGKLEEERFIQSMRQAGLRAAVLRLGTVYGASPGMRFHTAVNKFCWQAALGQPVKVWKTAMHQLRPYAHVRDVCKAIRAVLIDDLFDFDVMNVVSGNYTVEEILQSITNAGIDLQIELEAHELMNELSFRVETPVAKDLGLTFDEGLAAGVTDTLNLLSAFWRN